MIFLPNCKPNSEFADEPELKIMHPVKANAFENVTIIQMCGIQHVIAMNADGKNLFDLLWTSFFISA